MAYVYRATCRIAAPPEAVWAVLVDFEAYPAWNPFTREVRTTGAIGADVVMRVDMGFAVISQTEVLRALEPPTDGAPGRLVWGVDWLGGQAIAAERVQTLTADGDGSHYETVDTIGGWLSPVSQGIFGRPVGRGFRAMAEALRDRVESLAAR